jgi:hypothetical protein
MDDKRKKTLEMAFEALQKELEKAPVCPERVSALAETIKALAGIRLPLQL